MLLVGYIFISIFFCIVSLFLVFMLEEMEENRNITSRGHLTLLILLFPFTIIAYILVFIKWWFVE